MKSWGSNEDRIGAKNRGKERINERDKYRTMAADPVFGGEENTSLASGRLGVYTLHGQRIKCYGLF